MGALGVISVASNIIPAQMAELCRLCLEGDFAAARQLHYRYADLFSKLFIEVNPIPIKTAMNYVGLDVGQFRRPLCEMGEDNRLKLIECLKSCGIA